MKNTKKQQTMRSIAIIAIAAVIGFAFITCDDGNSKSDDTVSINAIGVTAPVQGAAPVTEITANEQYTGTVAWNGTPAAFAYNTAYTATITLTAKSGYTLEGVPADFFTVAGAQSVSNAANSGVVTATFSPIAIIYIITDDASSFTAAKGGATVDAGTNVETGEIQDVIDVIRTNAGGEPVSIQFGTGGSALDIGTASAQFTNVTGSEWGLITLSGKITSANITSTEGTVLIGANVSVNSTADIAVTSSTTTNGRAIYKSGAGTVNISGGTVSATSGRAVYIVSNSTATVNISDGTVSAATGYAVYNGSSNATVNISGGTISTTTGQAVRNDFNGTVNISGGTVSATTGYAVYNDYNGIINVSGSALVTSANTNTGYGTIYCSTLGTSTTINLTRIVITGGTVQNTSATTGNAVYNASIGRVEISGGTILAPTYAVQNTTTNSTTANAGAIILGGDPDITGRLRPAANGRLSVTTSFNPSTGRSYILDYSAYAADDIAVIGGASSATNFSLHNATAWKLAVSGSDLVIAAVE